MDKKSSVIKLYKLFFQTAWAVGSRTPEKDDQIAAKFWSLLIVSGHYFAEKDFLKLDAQYKTAYWGPSYYPPDEGHYHLAVHENNISFCQTYEKKHHRKPFIGKGIDYGYTSPEAVTVHQTQSRTQGRLVMRCTFMWKGERVTVTNFKDENQSLIACGYHDSARTQVKKRFVITHEEWEKQQSLAKDIAVNDAQL